MRIEILRPVMISGEPVGAGSILEASITDANLLIGMNKARLAPEPQAEPEPEPVCEMPKRSRKSAPSTAPEEV